MCENLITLFDFKYNVITKHLLPQQVHFCFLRFDMPRTDYRYAQRSVYFIYWLIVNIAWYNQAPLSTRVLFLSQLSQSVYQGQITDM